MSNKADLQRKLTEIGYDIGPFASKDTLSIVIRLHSLVRKFISFCFSSYLFVFLFFYSLGFT